MVHGQQELALFNTHAGGHCFQPIHIFEANSGKPVLSLMRPGKRPSGEEIARVLAHVIHRIRRRWPKVAILVRGDGHYCAPEVLDLLRKLRCDYILGLSRNKTLDALAAPWREQCQWRWKPSLGRVRRFHQFKYAADMVARGEGDRPRRGDRARHRRALHRHQSDGRAKHLYEKVYCQRGTAENLIKDMKLATRSDKTACSRWQANQFRLFLHMGAYWLLHSLRMAAPKKSRWRGATFATIRNAFVKIAVRVEEMKRRSSSPSRAICRTPMRWRSSPVASPRKARDRRGRCRTSPDQSPSTRAERPAPAKPSIRPMKHGHLYRASRPMTTANRVG